MADISKEDLRKEIAAILKDADLSSTSAKKVRQELEEKLGANLQSRKKEIDDLVMEFVNSKQEKKKGKKGDSDADEDEEEEGEDEEEEESEEEKKEKRPSAGKKPPAKKAKKNSDDESASEQSEGDSEEEYSPKKSKPIKTRKLPPKKKKGSESDSDEDWAKSKKGKKGTSSDADSIDDFNYELAQAFRKSNIPLSTLDHPTLRTFLATYCQREVATTEKLMEQFGLCDSDSDENEGGGGGGGKKGGSGYTKTLTLSPELAALVGKESMARHEVVQKVWAIIKEKNLYDPKNKQYAICDDALMKVIGVKRFRTFGMMKYLKNHFIS
ncbi:hypothetical protein NQ318_009485 [Aromia moschata]|uniref:Upstream activation factor subunit spp27 n=1 Tax=Aromia moschata TaxID=1265417 RepID=A0AAV8Z709_9CUCU|nr:hypothetical protein NQ318_009485 [Aromia moschata]